MLEFIILFVLARTNRPSVGRGKKSEGSRKAG